MFLYWQTQVAADPRDPRDPHTTATGGIYGGEGGVYVYKVTTDEYDEQICFDRCGWRDLCPGKHFIHTARHHNNQLG